MEHVLARVEGAVLAGLLGLPRPVMRLLAGRPVVRDGQVLDLETQWLLRVKALLREPAAEALPVADGRALLARQCRLVGGRPPVGAVRELTVPGGDGPVPARLYTPRALVGAAGPAPLLMYLHGGGMVYGDLDTHDAVCRTLAERAEVLVLAVDYRLAPEHPFPAAVEDCTAAYRWVAGHADELGADPCRLAVGGDSAGGYLAALVALRAAEAGLPLAFQLLVYPVTDLVGGSASRRLFGRGFYLTTEFMDLAADRYLAGRAGRRDPLVSVAYTEQLPAGLAPACVVTAGFDPLRDEGEAWARTLAEAGVEVRLRRFPGLIHGFLNVVGVGRSQRAAVAEVAGELRVALHREPVR